MGGVLEQAAQTRERVQIGSVEIKWRKSGGRGEFEVTPSESPLDRDIHLTFPALDVQIAAEVYGAHIDGKHRLRKHNSNDRTKLHLPQLVFAVAQLPEPARSDKGAPVEEEEIVGQEGKLLTRLHVYKERDRGFVRQVREHYRRQGDGRLVCQACDRAPVETYGPVGESCMEAHHRVPIEQLQPDSVTRLEDMAMLCASCHRVVHSAKPCLEVDNVKELIKKRPIPME